MAELQRKDMSLGSAATGDDGNGWITGYAAVKNVLDQYNDVITDGAFKSLDMLVQSGYSAMNHGRDPIGWFSDAKEDSKGLFVKIQFHSTKDAQDCRQKIVERIAAGKDVGMSIMYKVDDESYIKRDGKEIRELKSITVVEAGFVTLPVNTSAGVTAVKAGAGTTLADDFEAAREQFQKVIARVSDLKGSVSGELSTGRVENLKALAQQCSDLLEKCGPAPEPEMASTETVVELAPGW